MSLKSTIRQYGLYRSFKRLLKMTLRKLGFHYESFWYLINSINIEEVRQEMRKYSYDDVKELTINDFKNGDSEIFNEDKLELIKDRLKNNKFWSYGILHNSILVYSTWISKNNINFNTTISKTLPLNSRQAVLEDSYCHPNFRGKGLHSKMNLYRLLKSYEQNNNDAIAIVVSENIPALKVQLKSGFRKEKKIIFIKFFNNSYYIEKQVNDRNKG